MICVVLVKWRRSTQRKSMSVAECMVARLGTEQRSTYNCREFAELHTLFAIHTSQDIIGTFLLLSVQRSGPKLFVASFVREGPHSGCTQTIYMFCIVFTVRCLQPLRANSLAWTHQVIRHNVSQGTHRNTSEPI